MNRAKLTSTLSKITRLLLACAALVLFARAAHLLAELLGPGAGTGQLTDALGNTFDTNPASLLAVGTGFGVLLLGAWLLGKVAALAGLSKITGFLIFGVLLGPGVFEIITVDQLEYLKLVNGLAVALIALTAGSEMHLPFLKKYAKAILLIGGIEMVIVMVLITVLMETMFHIDNSQIILLGGESTGFWVALTIGTIAAANSPAVVIAILTETGARGVMAQTGLAVTVVKDLLTIVVFAVVLALAITGIQHAIDEHGAPVSSATSSEQPAGQADVQPADTPEPTSESASESEGNRAMSATDVVIYLIKHVPGSVAAGVLVALVGTLYIRRVGAHLAVVLIGGGFAIALLSGALGLEPLIVGLTAGFVMRNFFASDQMHELFETVEELSMPVYAVFFAVAGCKVDPAKVADVWYYVVALVLLRGVGTGVGCWIGGKLGGVKPPARNWIWASLIPQAGIALALTQKINEEFADWPFMEKVYAIMLSSVAVHELIGPLVFKFALWRAGETGGQNALDEDSPGVTDDRREPVSLADPADGMGPPAPGR